MQPLRTCGITLEETADCIDTPCCTQVISHRAWLRLWVGSTKPGCPFCRAPLPLFDADKAAEVLRASTPSGNALFRR